MTKAALTEQALALPVDEQIELAQELWQRASPPDRWELSQELKGLLEARRAEALREPGASVPWSEMKARLLKRA